MESVVRYCRNHKRGCKTILESSYKKRACESCLEKDRLKDKQRRERVKNSEFDAENEQFCNTCNKVKEKKEKQTEELLLRYNDENIVNRVKELCEK